MIGLVLAAGRGKRINEITRYQNKCMLMLDGRPLLDYHLESAVQAGVNRFVVVIGYLGDSIRQRFGHSYQGRPIEYIEQQEQHGLVHAITMASPLLDDDFLLMLGDEFFLGPRHAELVKTFYAGNYFGLCGTVHEPDPATIRKTYSVLLGKDDRVCRLIEKPRKPVNHIKGTGVCAFRRAMLDYIEFTPVHYLRKEKELPGLIQEAVDDGEHVGVYPICERYLNMNQIEDLEEFARAHGLAVGEYCHPVL